MIKALDVKKVREISGASLSECKFALEKTNGDILLACGYLNSYGLAVLINGDREKWNMQRAENWKQRYIEKYGEIE